MGEAVSSMCDANVDIKRGRSRISIRLSLKCYTGNDLALISILLFTG